MTGQGRRLLRSAIYWLRIAAYGISTAVLVTFLTVVSVFQSTWVICSAGANGTASCVVAGSNPWFEGHYPVADVVGVMVDESEGESGSDYALRLMTVDGPRGPHLGKPSGDERRTSGAAERLSTSISGTRLGASAMLTESPSTDMVVVLLAPVMWLVVAGWVVYLGGGLLRLIAAGATRSGRFLLSHGGRM